MPEMQAPEGVPPPTDVFIYLGRLRATLTLEDDRVRFTTKNKPITHRAATVLAKKAGDPSLADRMREGGGVVLFEADKREVIARKRKGFGDGLRLTVGETTWYVVFHVPSTILQGPAAVIVLPFVILGVVRGRRARKPWLQALTAGTSSK
jgi:hypothetical protein